MPATTLERRPGRVDLTAFGLALAIVAAAFGGAAAVIAVAAGAGKTAWLLPGLGLVPAVAGALSPWSLAGPYRSWNRLAARFARVARTAVLGVAFAVFTVVGRAGARFALRPDAAGPGWTPKSPPGGPGASGRQDDVPWFRRLLAWGQGTENRWSAWLVPYLLLLEWLEADREAGGAEDIYTLY